MSPLQLRRYRAERLLRRDFERLRWKVIAGARGRLRGREVTVEESVLEACYAQAWQGLYAAVIEGEELESPLGWLTMVTYRRALDEHRAEQVARRAALMAGAQLAQDREEREIADELADRAMLRQVMEGMLGDLSERERQAACLCYLQGLSRDQAAERMGIGRRRMRRLMEGGGRGRPGVAGKLGEITQTISAGRFCEERASLMRALAFGVLDPDGERHALARMHWRSCPACRAYVRSLRGLAATLPPVFLPGPLAALGLGRRAGTRMLARSAGASGKAPAGVVARAGARLAASVKPAALGLATLGVGVGVLAVVPGSPASHRRSSVVFSGALAGARAAPANAAGARAAAGAHAPARASRHGAGVGLLGVPAAWREFGIEREPVSARPGATRGGSSGLRVPRASTARPGPRAAAGGHRRGAAGASVQAGRSAPEASEAGAADAGTGAAGSSSPATTSGQAGRALREFGFE